MTEMRNRGWCHKKVGKLIFKNNETIYCIDFRVIFRNKNQLIYDTTKQRNKDGEHNNRPYDMDEAIVRFYLSELRDQTMTELGIEKLPEQCIPELYKEPTMYCKVYLAPPHSENDKTCLVGYNDFGKLVLMDGNENEPNMEPQHIHFCIGDSKQGELAYSASQGIIGVNGDSFDHNNEKCIASTDLSFAKPWKIVGISKDFANALVKMRGKIENVELILTEKDGAVAITEGECIIGAECFEYLQKQIAEKENQLA